MRRRRGLQMPDAKLIAFLRAILELCEKNLLLWGLKAEDVEKLAALLERAELDYAANLNPVLKNSSTASDKRKSFTALKKFARWFIDSLEVNLKVPDEALDKMGLPPREKPANQPDPLPITHIVITFKKIDNILRLQGSQIIAGQPKSTVGPKKLHFGIIFKVKVEGEPEPRIIPTTKLHVDIAFPPEYKGKHVKVSGAWLNSRLDPGPWCDEIEIILD